MALQFYVPFYTFRPFLTSLRLTQGLQLSKITSSFNKKRNVSTVNNCHHPEIRQSTTVPPGNTPVFCSGLYALPPKTSPAILEHSSVLHHTHLRSGCHVVWLRPLSTSASRFSFTTGNRPLKNDEQPTSDGKEKSDNEGWLIRLANENGYLSWCRNVYIATIVGVTTQLQQLIPYYTETAFLFFFMGGLNLVTGTTLYIFNMLKIRRRVGMSVMGMSTLSLLAVLHMLLWFSAVTLYLGYTVDEEEDEEEKEKAQIKGYIVDVRAKPGDA